MSDFDHTLTYHHVNGQSGCTSHGKTCGFIDH